MSTSVIILGLIVAGLLAFGLGVSRANALAKKGDAQLHSRPGYYGTYLALWTLLPALLVTLLWSAAEPSLVRHFVAESLPANVQALSPAEQSLVIGRVASVARGLPKLSNEEFEIVRKARYGFTSPADAQRVLQERGIALGSAPEPYVIAAAYDQADLQNRGKLYITCAAIGLALLGFLYANWRVHPKLRARNGVEKRRPCRTDPLVHGGHPDDRRHHLLDAVREHPLLRAWSIRCASSSAPSWDPRFSAAGNASAGEGQFGLMPLLWGTLYISLVALLVAVPVGLFAAIYMSEYASRKVRTVAKPLLEILAGIPTIVYGFFALITFGPFLRDAGGHIGLSISADERADRRPHHGRHAHPVRLVAVGRHHQRRAAVAARRLLGLGATQSETIKRVILPAALPGIVGAVLLAASRAIGETMIVVLAAGIAANLTLNPFEPVTTITVKIVSQLTGDLEFNSPQTLVAFALGLTLFVFTLCLNIYALYIVRKYREQYE